MNNMKIANRYAKAVYIEAVGAGTIVELESDVDQLQNLLKGNPDFVQLVKSPVLTADEKLQVMGAICKKSAFSKLVQGLLSVMTINKRLDLLPMVVESIKKIIYESRGEVEAFVYYASPINDSIREKLLVQLNQLTGKKVLVREYTDSSILGGVRVQIGSNLYDVSIKGKLDSLKSELMRKN